VKLTCLITDVSHVDLTTRPITVLGRLLHLKLIHPPQGRRSPAKPKMAQPMRTPIDRPAMLHTRSTFEPPIQGRHNGALLLSYPWARVEELRLLTS